MKKLGERWEGVLTSHQHHSGTFAATRESSSTPKTIRERAIATGICISQYMDGQPEEDLSPSLGGVYCSSLVGRGNGVVVEDRSVAECR